MKRFTIQQLQDHERNGGRPVLIAVGGKVYDVSSSQRWTAGVHMKRHHAWADLTNDIKAAPHGMDVLDRFPLIGTVEELPQKQFTGFRSRVELWLEGHPFFRRHPHPAIVHFPLGLLLTAPLLAALAYFFNSAATEWASFCCLVLGVATVPMAIATGYVTWWLNYEFAPSALILRKRFLGWIALFLGVALILIRASLMWDPFSHTFGQRLGYFFGLALLSLITAYIGYLGGKLTFPYD
jgi:predicted heme/steroid binding protein/uncharacterized membrane protein